MTIIKRLAEEDYCFVELHFDSLDEYKQGYPEFVKTYKEVKGIVKELIAKDKKDE